MKGAHKKGAPDERSPWVLTTSRGHGIVFVRRNTGVSLSTLSKDSNSTNSVRFPSLFSRPQGGLAVAVIRAHPGQNCIPSDPLDAGVSQNRSSGHEGEGPPARKAKGYGQWRWVGQHGVSRIGVPKASNDGVLV